MRKLQPMLGNKLHLTAPRDILLSTIKRLQKPKSGEKLLTRRLHSTHAMAECNFWRTRNSKSISENYKTRFIRYDSLAGEFINNAFVFGYIDDKSCKQRKAYCRLFTLQLNFSCIFIFPNNYHCIYVTCIGLSRYYNLFSTFVSYTTIELGTSTYGLIYTRIRVPTAHICRAQITEIFTRVSVFFGCVVA